LTSAAFESSVDDSIVGRPVPTASDRRFGSSVPAFNDGTSRLLNRLPSRRGKGPPRPSARSGGTMAISSDEKYKDYAHYAAHCLYLETAASDPDSRAIQREMAAEWLKLANAVRRHPRPEQVQME
jgi:hypothetical protein